MTTEKTIPSLADTPLRDREYQVLRWFRVVGLALGALAFAALFLPHHNYRFVSVHDGFADIDGLVRLMGIPTLLVFFWFGTNTKPSKRAYTFIASLLGFSLLHLFAFLLSNNHDNYLDGALLFTASFNALYWLTVLAPVMRLLLHTSARRALVELIRYRRQLLSRLPS